MNKVEKVEVEKFEDEYGGFAFVKNIFRPDRDAIFLKEFREWHLLLLVYIQRFTVFHTNKMNFTMSWFYNDFNIEDSGTIRVVKSAFSELIEMGLIEVDKDIEGSNRNTRLTVNKIDYGDTFTKIYHSELDKIMSIDVDNEQKGTLLFIFTVIVSRIDEKGFSFPSYKNISKSLSPKNADKRISDALKLLVENELLVYDSSAMIYNENGNKVPAYSIYARCIDKDHMKHLKNGIDYRERDYEKKNIKVFNKGQADLKRSINPSMKHLWQKVIDKSISATELEKLNELENKYYNLIKSDGQKLIKFKDNFMTIEIDEKLELVNTRIKTELEKEIEEKLKLF